MEKPVGTSPNLKITMVNGSGGKISIGLTYNGQPFTERWIGGGDAFSITTLEKAKLGDEFTLTAIKEPGRKNMGVRINGYPCPIESSVGDTLYYNLGNLKTYGDSVVITSLYQDLADFSKSRIHIKSKGSAGNLTRWALHNSTKKNDVFNEAIADMPVLDRIDTLDVNTQYYFAFYGSTENLKRVMINGVEVELTGTSSIKRTPNRILRSFDDEIFIEFESEDDTHKMLNAYANNDVLVAIAKVVEGEEPHYVSRENSLHQWVNKGEAYIIKFTPKNGEELIRFDIGWNSVDIQQESRLVKNDDGSYSFTLTYDDIPTTQDHFDMLAVFESSQTGTSYDLNNDGQVNITDVIVLVNRILGNN